MSILDKAFRNRLRSVYAKNIRKKLWDSEIFCIFAANYERLLIVKANIMKYLMRGMAALAVCAAFVSCSHDVDLGGSVNQGVQQTYEEAFRTRFGEPAPTQDWGFGSSRAMTRANNPGDDYPATSTGINANANEWADPTEGKTYGGWVVPDPLTQAQKDLVSAYFQTHPNLTYEDPQWRHFFVQQVYKGGAPEDGEVGDTTEGLTGADGTSYSSDNMNLLTVGYNEQHINNFNAGSASTVGVLDKGYTANDFDNHKHDDQIMLMVNIDDTECMGYHNTGSSIQRNDKAALVDWETIRTWARAEGIYTEDILNDGWDRSFVGFDFALQPLENLYLKDQSGNTVYAKRTDGQKGGLQYVYDGTNVIPANSVVGSEDYDIIANHSFSVWHNGESFTKNSDGTITYNSDNWGGLVTESFKINGPSYQKVVIEFEETTTKATKVIVYIEDDNNKWTSDAYVAAGTKTLEYEIKSWDKYITQLAIQTENAINNLKISRIYLKGQESVNGYGEYLMVDGKKVPYISTNANMYSGEMYGGRDEAFGDGNMEINIDGKACFNMVEITKLVRQGYLPVKDKNLRTWVKVNDGDGYFSDWIVTLTKANRIENSEKHETTTSTESMRVIAEDLTVDQNTDFDFNDVVFDVVWTRTLTDGVPTSQEVKVILQAAGGTLPLYVAGHEVHEEFGEDQNVMINTSAAAQGLRGNDNAGTREITLTDDQWSGSTIGEIAKSIEVKVIKGGQPYILEAPEGGIASKIGVDIEYVWCIEREDIDNRYSLSDGTPLFSEWVKGLYPANDWYTYAKDEIAKYKAAKAALNGEGE